ncbi:MAG TPA: zinc ABC transporter substrate-binding protein [Actinocrinis sp.]|jgi:zinc/manganese transport system substrate-binding protein
MSSASPIRPGGRGPVPVRAAPLAAALAAAALAAAACSSPQPSQSTDAGMPIQVVAAESIWGDIAGQLGGSNVDVVNIMTASTLNPAAFTPTKKQLADIAGSQVYIIDGCGYDPWADQAANAEKGGSRMEIDAGGLVGVEPGSNPYLWYNPSYVLQMAQQIEADYAQLRPNEASYFKQQLQNFQSNDLGSVNSLISSIKGKYKGTKVGASDPVAVPLAASLGLDLVTPQAYLTAGGGAATASAADQQNAAAQITGHQIKVFFFDVQDLSPAAHTEVQDAGTAQIPVAAVSETVEPDSATYEQWQTSQLQQIQQVLAATAGSAGH